MRITQLHVSLLFDYSFFQISIVILFRSLIDCEQKQEKLQSEIQELSTEESGIVHKQNALKKDLYGRFGNRINLEN